MSEILEINGGNVKVGNADGTVGTWPISSVRYANPKVGDTVQVYNDGDTTIINSVAAPASTPIVATHGDRRHINKIVYILLTFFFGALGVHRFMRGQIGLGILMLLIGWWATLGIWPLVDFIISLTKLSSYPGDDYVFTPDGRFANV